MSPKKKAKNYPNPDAFNSCSLISSSHDLTGFIPSGVESQAEYASYSEISPLTNDLT